MGQKVLLLTAWKQSNQSEEICDYVVAKQQFSELWFQIYVPKYYTYLWNAFPLRAHKQNQSLFQLH